MSILDDQKVIETYVKMFCNLNEENATKEGVKNLLRTSFNIAMTFNSGDAHSCLNIENTLDAVTATCFFQEPLSVGFVSRWLEENCAKIILPINRYVLHLLTTSYRNIQTNMEEKASNGMELLSPVLEKGKPFETSKSILCLSLAWLLAATLPPVFSRPQSVPKANKENKDDDEPSNPATSPSAMLPSQVLLAHYVII
jgi:hypothetical protein